MRLLVLFTGLALILTGCAPFNLVEPKPREIGTAYSVEPTIAWNAYSKQQFGLIDERWTIDGFGLGDMRFWHDVNDGEALFESRVIEYPTFQSDMRPTEVAELYAGSLSKADVVDFETQNLRPAKFGSVDGFRFELSYLLASGLKVRGTALAAIVDQKLQLIVYSAPELHYYSKNLDEAEKVMASVQLL